MIKSHIEVTVLSLFKSGESDNTVTHVLEVDLILSSFINMNILSVSHSVFILKLKFLSFFINVCIKITDVAQRSQFYRLFNRWIILVIN